MGTACLGNRGAPATLLTAAPWAELPARAGPPRPAFRCLQAQPLRLRLLQNCLSPEALPLVPRLETGALAAGCPFSTEVC